MQVPPQSPSLLVEIIRSPWLMIIAIPALLQLVLRPAVVTLLRRDMHRELEQLDQIPVIKVEIKRHEEMLSALSTVTVQLGRIEERLTTLFRLIEDKST